MPRTDNLMSQDLNAELSRVYERCIEQIRRIAALDPTNPVEGWDPYACTAADEFAADVEMAWIMVHPEHEVPADPRGGTRARAGPRV